MTLRQISLNYFATLVNNPASLNARKREAILSNAQHIAKQPNHPLYKQAVKVVQSLQAAEKILPPASNLIKIGKIKWDRKSTRNKKYRGFLKGELIATVVHAGKREFYILKPCGALSDSYTSLSAARMATPYEIAAPYFKPAA